MGFHLRKSFNFGGLRLNLSNSGIGFSTGIKGLRVGVDGKGRAYVGGGKGILRYRKTLSSSKDVNTASAPVIDTSEKPQSLVFWTGIKIVWMVLYAIIASFLIVGGFGAIFAPKPDFSMGFWLLFFAIFPYYRWIVKPKKIKYLDLALQEYENKNYDLAFEYFEKSYCAVKKKSYDEKKYISTVWYNCLYELNKFEEALNLLNGVNGCHIDNKDLKILNCYYGLERWEESLSLLQNELKYTREKTPMYFMMLGDCLLRLNKPETALEAMLQGPAQSKKMDYNMCCYRYQLGLCYEAVGDVNNALKQYRKIYAYDANFSKVAGKLERLENPNNSIQPQIDVRPAEDFSSQIDINEKNSIFELGKPQILDFMSDNDYDYVVSLYLLNKKVFASKIEKDYTLKEYPYGKLNWWDCVNALRKYILYKTYTENDIKKMKKEGGIKKIKLICSGNCQCCQNFKDKEISIDDVKELPIPECEPEGDFCKGAVYQAVLSYDD